MPVLFPGVGGNGTSQAAGDSGGSQVSSMVGSVSSPVYPTNCNYLHMHFIWFPLLPSPSADPNWSPELLLS